MRLLKRVLVSKSKDKDAPDLSSFAAMTTQENGRESLWGPAQKE